MSLRSLKPLSTSSPTPRNKMRYNYTIGTVIKQTVAPAASIVSKQTGSSKKSPKSPLKPPKTVKKTKSRRVNNSTRSPVSRPINHEDDFTKGIDLSQISQWIAITAQVQDIIKGFVKTAPQPQPVIVVQGTTKDTSGQVPQVISNSQVQTKQNASVLNKIKSFFK